MYFLKHLSRNATVSGFWCVIDARVSHSWAKQCEPIFHHTTCAYELLAHTCRLLGSTTNHPPPPLYINSSWAMPISDNIPPSSLQWKGGQRRIKAAVPLTHRMQLLQNGHCRHVTPTLKWPHSVSVSKSRGCRKFLQKLPAASLTGLSIMLRKAKRQQLLLPTVQLAER